MFFNVSAKYKWLVLVFVITIIILIFSIFFILNIADKIKNGEVLNGEVDLNFDEYYVEYDMTVISNKNINTYAVKEWHKESVITKLEYLDYMRNTVTITLKDNTCSIINSGNAAKLVINNIIENKNIASLSTFGYLYNSHDKMCKCYKERHIKDNEEIITISLCEGCNCSCNCNKIIEDMGIATLKLILVNGIPKNYIVYYKNKTEYISIVYNVFKNNIEI